MAKIFAHNSVINVHLETTVDGLPGDKEQQDRSQGWVAQGPLGKLLVLSHFTLELDFLYETHAIILCANKKYVSPFICSSYVSTSQVLGNFWTQKSLYWTEPSMNLHDVK